MNGKVYIIIGARGTGKSSLVKGLLKYIHINKIFIYDVQAEYGLKDFDELPDIDEFLDIVIPLYEHVIVFEEATIFFSNRGSNKKIRKHLVDARHHKNIVFLLFHSVRSVPHYLFDLTDYVFLLQTNDSIDLVTQKNELLVKPFLKVMSREPTKYPKITYEIINLNTIKLNFWKQ